MSRKPNPLPSVELLHALFEDVGHTVRRHSTGRLTAKPTGNGYLMARIGIAMYLVHRILYKMRTGQEPDIVDHRDGNKLNNAQDNLRAADEHTNQYNRGRARNNTPGEKGVFWDRGKWRVIVIAEGKPINGGRFTNLADASAKAEALRQQYHGEFAGEV